MTRIIGSIQTESPGFSGREIRLQFKLFGAGRTSGDRGPLKALVFHPGEGWQGRRRVRPMGSGLFEVTLPAPWSGSFCLFLDCQGAGHGSAGLSCLIVQAVDGPGTATCTPGRTNCATSGVRRLARAPGPVPKVVERTTPMPPGRRVAS